MPTSIIGKNNGGGRNGGDGGGGVCEGEPYGSELFASCGSERAEKVNILLVTCAHAASSNLRGDHGLSKSDEL